ncbi:MAG: hypothetical protein PT120_18040 [Aphanizomenon gracile PMC649.10]|nr:hypothetical protein [Aphanizomenon gracile PMC638.10]MDM3856732.1 hypothetical protein [Aphanizomenon gracile PMC649.10]
MLNTQLVEAIAWVQLIKFGNKVQNSTPSQFQCLSTGTDKMPIPQIN